MLVLGGLSGVRAVEAPASQWAQYEADVPKTVVELQPFRQAQTVPLPGGSATLIDLNPAVGSWLLLTVQTGGFTRHFHLENPAPATQHLRLGTGPHGSLQMEGLAGAEPCELALPLQVPQESAASSSSGPAGEIPGALGEARRSGLPYAPLCGGHLYLRNPVAGHHSNLERITDFLRSHVYGGEKVISFVKKGLYRDAFREQGAARPPGKCVPAPDSPDGPRPAKIGPLAAARCLGPGTLGIDVGGTAAGFAPGRWYPVREMDGVQASVLTPADLAPAYLAPAPHLNRLDATESGALVYLVAFDLSQFDLHFALGTDHPRLDWSVRTPDALFDPRLPGPDGVGSAAPLEMNGLISPVDAGRTVAAFAAGFKRDHGAFRSGPLSRGNHGSHYGFIQEGVILSKLQPGLATVLVTSDGRVDLRTWQVSNTALGHLRFARQNGVPLIERDPKRGGVPGALVSRWGAGNWSGSADKLLRTLRAGACLQETGSRRFLLYGYFSTATPSAMARVFQAYGCSYAMQLDMNALEHTYLALYVHRGGTRIVEHLVQGMDACDRQVRGGMVPRFLAAPDDRDFFYLTRREPPAK